MRKSAFAVVVGFLFAFVFASGYYLGRAKVEREWRLPPMVLSAADVSRLSGDGANPVPPAGTKILAAMPLERTRRAVHEFAASDPVKVAVGSLARGDDGATEMTLVVQNDSACEVSEVAGTAYGFDAAGRSAKVNAHGEHFVGFASAVDKLAPNRHANMTMPIRHLDSASIALALVDRFQCTDGTRWARP